MFPKSHHQIQVDEFMQKAGQATPNKPTMPSVEERRLRSRLIFEEALETIEALGFLVSINDTGCETGCRPWVNMRNVNFDCAVHPHLEKIIDGCCDIAVVTTGTLSACGIPDIAFQTEVNLNNLKKFEGGHRDEVTGKWIKPFGFKGPDIAGLLDKYTKQCEERSK